MLKEVCGSDGKSGPHPFPTKAGWDFATSKEQRSTDVGAVYRRFNTAKAWVKNNANPVFAALMIAKDGELTLPSGTTEDEMRNMVLVNVSRNKKDEKPATVEAIVVEDEESEVGGVEEAGGASEDTTVINDEESEAKESGDAAEDATEDAAKDADEVPIKGEDEEDTEPALDLSKANMVTSKEEVEALLANIKHPPFWLVWCALGPMGEKLAQFDVVPRHPRKQDEVAAEAASAEKTAGVGAPSVPQPASRSEQREAHKRTIDEESDTRERKRAMDEAAKLTRDAANREVYDVASRVHKQRQSEQKHNLKVLKELAELEEGEAKKQAKAEYLDALRASNKVTFDTVLCEVRAGSSNVASATGAGARPPQPPYPLPLASMTECSRAILPGAHHPRLHTRVSRRRRWHQQARRRWSRLRRRWRT